MMGTALRRDGSIACLPATIAAPTSGARRASASPEAPLRSQVNRRMKPSLRNKMRRLQQETAASPGRDAKLMAQMSELWGPLLVGGTQGTMVDAHPDRQ